MATLRINGTDREFPEEALPATLLDLLNTLQIDQATVVAEINGAIIERKYFAQTPIQEGQSLELVRFVGGG
ncbi:MAG: sulfur carrier protein ThiS [Sedimentisphaerales bacterium]|nr:sulfur carrier protein ThiS [Sedimentisphaerales bacterium]